MKTDQFYGIFSNEDATELILKLQGEQSLNQGYTTVEFVSLQNELIASHQIGGKLDFDQLSLVRFPLKNLKRKFKGLIQINIRSTFEMIHFLLELSHSKKNQEDFFVPVDLKRHSK